MKLGWIRWQQVFQHILFGQPQSWQSQSWRLPSWNLERHFTRLIGAVCATCLILLVTIQPAWASLTNDNFDGEIFALYAGNGSIVPPKNDLSTTLKQGKAAVMVFYVDDSHDCKEFSLKISNLQALYNKVTNFIPIRVDSLPVQESYEPSEAGYYYKGYVPQTVIFDPQGQVRFDESGQVAFEAMDDTMRDIFGLLPRTESTTLKRRPVNEVSGELVN